MALLESPLGSAVLALLVVYIVLTTVRIDDEAIVFGASVVSLSVTGASLPLALGEVELPALDYSFGLVPWFLITPLILLAIQALAFGRTRWSTDAGPGNLILLAVVVPLGILVIARQFFPFLASQPERLLVSKPFDPTRPNMVHAFCLVSAAFIVWRSRSDPTWRAALVWPLIVAAAAGTVVLALPSFADAIRHSFGGDITAETAQPVRILAAGVTAIWVPMLVAAYRGPFGFRPWVPAVVSWRLLKLKAADSSLPGGQDMKARLTATLVIFLGIAGFAGARPLDLTNRILVHGAPTASPDPGTMVIAYSLDEPGDDNTPEKAWQSAEKHAWRNVRGADLSEYRFPDTNFSGSNLFDADFTRAALRGARFDGAQASAAQFEAACLHGATFRDATLIETRFAGADFTSTGRPCPIRVAQEGAATPALPPGAAPSLVPAPLPARADLSGAVLPHADFGKAETDAEGKCLSNPAFPQIGLDSARLDFSDLDCFEFSNKDGGLSLKGTSFIGVSLKGARFIGLTQFDPPPSFIWADLTDAVFEGDGEAPISLRGVDFRGANLTRVTFRNVDLTGARFACADLRNTKSDLSNPAFGSNLRLSTAILHDNQAPKWKEVTERRNVASDAVGEMLPPAPGLNAAGFRTELDRTEEQEKDPDTSLSPFDTLCPT